MSEMDEQVTTEGSEEQSNLTRRKLLVGAGVAIGAAGIATMVAQSDAKEPQTGTDPATPNALSATPAPGEVTSYANDWPVVQGDLQATRTAKNSPINSGNVSKLASLWQVPATDAITASPVIQGNTVYYQDMQSNVFALDLATGKELWRTEYKVPNNGPVGVAVAYGMVFAATGDTSTAFALDAKTGKEIWSSKLSNNDFECIDMAPAVYDSTVYISTNPNNTTNGNYRGGARGIIFALDAKTGKTLWTFDTSNGNLWGKARVNSGAGLWYPPSFDEDGSIYFGTGNAAPYPGNPTYPNGGSRPGQDDYAASMVSLDLATGAVNWSVNAMPHDIQDHDFQNSPVLGKVSLNGTDELLVAFGSGKTGTVIAADAKTGATLWKTFVGKHSNDLLEELPEGTTEIYPGTLGGVLTPMAFSDSRVFVPYNDAPAYLSPDGAGQRPDTPVPPTGGFCALDGATGSVLWDNKLPAYVVGGATVVNDLVFTTGLDGVLHAYKVDSGEEAWNWEIPAGVNAPLGVAGDTIVFAATSAINVSPLNGTPAPTEQRTPTPSIIALKLGS